MCYTCEKEWPGEFLRRERSRSDDGRCDTLRQFGGTPLVSKVCQRFRVSQPRRLRPETEGGLGHRGTQWDIRRNISVERPCVHIPRSPLLRLGAHKMYE